MLADEGNNLVRMYCDYCGTETVPERYTKWAIISVIAASLAGRVWIDVNWYGRPFHLRPNLYTLLVGEAASFKSAAIIGAKDLLMETDYAESTVHNPPFKEHAQVQVYRGTLNGKTLIDAMVPTVHRPWLNQMYWVADELANHLGTDHKTADITVRGLTDMYYLGDYQESTRTSGYNRLAEGYCINVVWGTTPTWLKLYIPKSAVSAGFFRRVCTIIERTQRRAKFDPPRSANTVVIHDKMLGKLNDILEMEGQFVRTKEAYQWEREWWESRPLPTDSVGWSYDQTQRDWLEKFGMIHSAASSPSYEIGLNDYEIAWEWVKDASENPMTMLRSDDRIDELATTLQEKIRGSRSGVSRSELAIWCNQHRITVKAIEDYLETWREAGNLTTDKVTTPGRTKVIYRWQEEKDEGNKD